MVKQVTNTIKGTFPKLKKDKSILSEFDVRKIKISRYEMHGWAWFMGIIAFIIILALLAINENLEARIGVWSFISHAWSFAFTTFFSLFLISLGYYFMMKKTKMEVMHDE